ncbi:MAG: methylated-DNA--[protein]-cysteine S-methyltransferase [Promethearchaeota archaeon]
MEYLTFSTSFGKITIIWKGKEPDIQLQRIFLSDPTHISEKKAKESFVTINSGYSSLIESLADKIQRFLIGEDIEFDLKLLDFNICSETQKKVLKAEYGIPRGWVSTYKRIAAYIGKPNGARVVGNSLAKNPFPIVIPCHRAIKSNGEVGGYQGGLKMKKMLLEMEGVKISANGKANTEKIYY